jgi:hypothetical protein
MLAVALALALPLSLVACSGEDADGAGGAGGDAASASTGPKKTEHECFSTEATCNGKCVHLEDNPEHCGACNNSCSGGAGKSGQCISGSCVFECDPGFAKDGDTCRNLFGAHEAYPAECPGCGTANVYTGGCSCPAQSTQLSLAVQSDCPGAPLRSATTLGLCVTPGVSPESDFGGAYQVDDLPDWCGATAQCRVGNPLNGGACACPAGFDEAITLRSIIRLPCGGGEVGTQVILCGNKDAPLQSFGGAFQVDDLEPSCRVGNPWTGGCSCPAGTVDRVFRVMVDGPAGLYGSTFHLCTL